VCKNSERQLESGVLRKDRVRLFFAVRARDMLVARGRIQHRPYVSVAAGNHDKNFRRLIVQDKLVVRLRPAACITSVGYAAELRLKSRSHTQQNLRTQLKSLFIHVGSVVAM